jgi:hypothetical protein
MSTGGKTLLAAALILMCTPCGASEEYKYRAIMAKYFISQHSAMPLFNNGSAMSGSALTLPEEATRYSRDQCYSLDPPAYRNLGKEVVASKGAAALEAQGSGTAYRVVDVLGRVGVATASSNQIFVTLSQEEPQRGKTKGLALLADPKPACSELIALFNGARSRTILVTRVFWGTVQATTSFKVSGAVGAEAKARLGKDLAKVLGATPQISADASGSNLVIQINSATQPRSLAVQSAVVNPQVLARVYAAATGRNATLAQLENQVAEYLGTDRSAAQRIATNIRSLLIELHLIERDPQEFYDDLFSGIKPPGASMEDRDPKVWSAVGTVASAVEIARSAEPR